MKNENGHEKIRKPAIVECFPQNVPEMQHGSMPFLGKLSITETCNIMGVGGTHNTSAIYRLVMEQMGTILMEQTSKIAPIEMSIQVEARMVRLKLSTPYVLRERKD